MKKLFSLVAIAAVALTSFTSCGNKDNNEPTKAKLKLSADTKIGPNVEGKFTVTSDIDAPADIVVTVKSSDDKILTITDASVTIAKGKKTVEGKFKSVAEGKAKITIEAADATLSIASVEVEVGKSTSKIVQMGIDKTSWGGKYAYYEDPEDNRPAGERDNLAYFVFWANTYPPHSAASPGLCLDLGNTSGNPFFLMGNVVDNYLNISAQAVDSEISLSNMTETAVYPALWSSNYTDLATGEELYVAFACGNFANTTSDYRAWLKIKLGVKGGFDNFEILEAYLCLDNGPFKVGQKQ